jgi:DNA/RNA endonuclease YhcR with UshA esterase domain
MRPWRGTCGWCIGLVGVIAAAAFPAGAVQAAAISIAEARAAEPGTLVTVEGSVTVPSGRFSASTFDQGFAIQDGSAGIYVSVADDPKLNNHRRVRVTGVVGDDGYGQLVLRPGVDADVEILQGAARVAARQVATGDVGEATEGLLVEVTGSVVRGPTDDLPYGYSVYIDDGSGETQIFIPASTGINPFRIGYLDEGVAIRVTGVSRQFQNNLEVLPRTGGDIQRGR